MNQRSPFAEPPSRTTSEKRVGLFVDFESIRRAYDEPDAAELARELRELCEERGRCLVATAYGDWSKAAAAARELRRQQIEPRLVLGDGEAESLLVMSLDVLETLFLGPDLDVFVLVAADPGASELIQRLRRADRAVTQVGLTAAMAGVAGAAGFVRLDDLIGPPRERPRPHRLDFAALDWEPFIRLMSELEGTMPFVGFGWLLKKKLSSENSGCSTQQEKQELMDRAADEGILALYKVDNIEEGADPVTACKLNREHPRVLELLHG